MTPYQKYVAEWIATTMINEEPDFALGLVRSCIVDIIKERIAMRDDRSVLMFNATADLVKTVAPHWTVYNAILQEMEISYRKGDMIEKIVSMALRRLQDGLLHGRWMGLKGK